MTGTEKWARDLVKVDPELAAELQRALSQYVRGKKLTARVLRAVEALFALETALEAVEGS